MPDQAADPVADQVTSPGADRVTSPAAEPAAGRAAPGRRWLRSELWRFLELFALCGFVVVQPLLEIIGGSPDFLIFHGVGAGEIVTMVAILVLVPPVVLWGVGALAGLAGDRVRRVVHLAMVAGLFALFMIQLGKHLTGLRGTVLVVLVVLATVVVAVGYLAQELFRQLLRFTAVGPLVFVLLFTFASPASAVVLAADRPSTGGAAQVTGPNPPIVMIFLDELSLVSLLDPDGQIDAARFPHFARLAGDSTWYRNATSNAGWTPYSVPSMLTGRWPSQDAAPNYAVHPDNLFTLLGDVYEISASESITELCPPWHCGSGPDRTRGGLPVALTESASLFRELVSPVDPVRDPYDDFAEPTVRERLDEMAAARQDPPEFRFAQALAASQPVRFYEFVNGLRADPGDDTAPLHFLHLLLPHTPWRYFPDGMQYAGVPGLPVDGEWWGRLALQRYLLQLAYTDLLIGEILAELEASGSYDETMIVLTSDHGVSLTPDGTAGDRELPVDAPGIVELAWVPMFLKEPGQTEGIVDDRNWQHVDLLPTVADLAGVAVPWPVDGIFWRREQRTEPDKVFYPDLVSPGVIDGPAGFAKILADPTAIPALPPAPLPELVGTAVADHPVVDGGVRAVVEGAEAFDDVDPDSGVVPAMVHGTLPSSVPAGTPLAIAVNGRIAAVVPVVAEAGGVRRFVGLVPDHRLFVAGANQLELFLVPDAVTLQRV